MELKLSLTIQDQDKTNLEEVTGCNPILLRPLLSASTIIPDSQNPGSDEHHGKMIEHLLTTLNESGEAQKVREDVMAFVKDKHSKLASQQDEWAS